MCVHLAHLPIAKTLRSRINSQARTTGIECVYVDPFASAVLLTPPPSLSSDERSVDLSEQHTAVQ